MARKAAQMEIPALGGRAVLTAPAAHIAALADWAFAVSLACAESCAQFPQVPLMPPAGLVSIILTLGTGAEAQ